MRKLVLACATLAVAEVAVAQPYTYVPAPNAPNAPNTYVPSPSFNYPAAPGYVSPGASSGYALPGYQWRQERGDIDWRNNTWREDRFDNDWRNNNWQTRRELRDWQVRQDYSNIRTPNNATDEGNVECGKGPAGSSTPCSTNTNPYAKGSSTTKSEPANGNGYERTTDGYDKAPAGDKAKGVPRGVADCGHGSVWRRC